MGYKTSSQEMCAECARLVLGLGKDTDIFMHGKKVHAIVTKEVKLSNEKMTLVYLVVSMNTLTHTFEEAARKHDAKTIGKKLLWYLERNAHLLSMLLHYVEHHYGNEAVSDVYKFLRAEGLRLSQSFISNVGHDC